MGQRILVVTPDVLAEKMAGPAIRAWQIARCLAADAAGHAVTLASAAECSIEGAGFECRFVGWHELARFAESFDIVIAQGFVTYHAPGLLRSDKVLVLDLYDPIQLEQLEQLVSQPISRRRSTVDLTTRVFNEQLARGDFFMCASSEQRAFWLGQLAAVGRLSPENYDRDPTLRSLIDICPFGISDQAPRRTGPGIRDAVQGIGQDDKVLLWGGGLYDWFDPLSLVSAVGRLAEKHDDLRLFFLGTVHPNPDVVDMDMATRTVRLSDELGLTGRHVFFNNGWVPYTERANFLLDADAGVSTHVNHIETTFSFRTRILDYLWAGLPIVATGGDAFGELIAREGLGVRVDEGDVDHLAQALDLVLYDDQFAVSCRTNVARIREQFVWEQALAPLLQFCLQPARAADSVADQQRLVRRAVPPSNRAHRRLLRVAELVDEGGPRLLLQRAGNWYRRIRQERSSS
jgi:hypothetical protein